MFGWYTTGNPQEKRTFWACFLGWALDSYDLQIFSFFLPTLVLLWHISPSEAGLMGTAALLSASIGGWIAGIMSDRIGRVKVLLFTVGWFTLFGVIAGFAQNYHQLLLARTLQGIGFGGEWAVGAALMAEVIKPENRGRALGFVQSGFGVGWALSAIVATWLIANTPADLAWRLSFWLGVIPAAIVFGIRWFLEESHSFKTVSHQVVERAGLGTVFKPGLLRPSAFAALMVAGLQAGAYVVAIWLPTLLSARGVTTTSVLVNVLILALGTLFGFASCAYSSDRFGRRITLATMSVGAWIVTMLYMLIALSPAVTQIMGFLIGFFTIGTFAAVSPFLSELFPTYARTTCMGFSYNIGKTIGALAVTAVGVAAEFMSLAPAIALFSTISYIACLIALIFLEERRGVELGAGVAAV